MVFLHQCLSIWDDWLRNKSHSIYHRPVLGVNFNNTTGHKLGKLIAHLFFPDAQPPASLVRSDSEVFEVIGLNVTIDSDDLGQCAKMKASLCNVGCQTLK